MSLPKNLISFLNSPHGAMYWRDEKTQPYMEKAISVLLIEPSEEFLEFYELIDGVFSSEEIGYELLSFEDEGYDSVVTQTQVVRKHHSFPNNLVWFANGVELSGMVLDTNTDYVYEVHFEGATDELLEGTLKPTWTSFSDCINKAFKNAEYDVSV